MAVLVEELLGYGVPYELPDRCCVVFPLSWGRRWWAQARMICECGAVADIYGCCSARCRGGHGYGSMRGVWDGETRGAIALASIARCA